MNRDSKKSCPQGLKPAFLAALSGTAEAVPFHKIISRDGFSPLAPNH